MNPTARKKLQDTHHTSGLSSQTARTSESTTRLFHMPLEQLPNTGAAQVSSLRYLRTTRLIKRQLVSILKGTSLTSSQSHTHCLLPEDLTPQSPTPQRWTLPGKVLRRRTVHPTEPKQYTTAEQAALLTKEFPGKKFTRKPALVGHLPEMLKKRMQLALSKEYRALV